MEENTKTIHTKSVITREIPVTVLNVDIKSNV